MKKLPVSVEIKIFFGCQILETFLMFYGSGNSKLPGQLGGLQRPDPSSSMLKPLMEKLSPPIDRVLTLIRHLP